jgi:hypothetical protein
MVGCDRTSISNLKFLLYCFEWMSGLKINYHKSEVVVFGVDEETKTNIANMLNCARGVLPFKYLGFPISNRKLKAEAFSEVVAKMRKKLQPWKGKHLTSGGRLVLTNSSLSSMPTYMMSMYMLHEGVHSMMDTVMSRFFWRGDPDKFKYHMMNWDNVCLPKEFGGLGITNTRFLNEALILKWAWRLQSMVGEDICGQLLKAKYFPNKSFIQSSAGRGSQFWKGVVKVRWKLKWCSTSQVGDGRQTRFWEDTWLGRVPLKLIFPGLYNISDRKNDLVSDCYKQGEWVTKFRRSFGPEDVAQWADLLSMLNIVELQRDGVERDKFRWCLEKSGWYSTKSMYKFLAHRG